MRSISAGLAGAGGRRARWYARRARWPPSHRRRGRRWRESRRSRPGERSPAGRRRSPRRRPACRAASRSPRGSETSTAAGGRSATRSAALRTAPRSTGPRTAPAARGVGVPVGGDGDAVRGDAVHAPPARRGAAARRLARQVQLRRHGRLGPHIPGLGLVVGLGLLVDGEHRESRSGARRWSGRGGAIPYWRAAARVSARNGLDGWARITIPGWVSSSAPLSLSILAPQLVRAAGQRDVFLALADGQPGDPGVAMRRPPGMRGRVLVDPDDRGPARGQLPGRGAAHRAQPDDDHIGSLHRRMIAEGRP